MTWAGANTVAVSDAQIRAAVSSETVGRKLYPIEPGGEEDTAGLTDVDIVDWTERPGEVLRYVDNAVPGTTDLAAAVTKALSANTTVYWPRNKDVLLGSQIVVATGKRIIGHGATSDSATRGKSVAVRGFLGTDATFLISGDDAHIDGLDVDNDAQGTGECIKVTGTRFTFGRLSVRKSGGVGFRIGETEAGAGSINANLGSGQHLISLGNAGDGILFDHTNTTTSGNFPDGATNANAWGITHVDTRSNGGHGVRFKNTIDNTLINVVAQSNTGQGVKFDQYARGNTIVKAYTEGNVAGQGLLDAGADNNMVLGNRSITSAPGWEDNGSGNFLLFYRSATNGEFYLGKNVNISNQDAGATPALEFFADAGLANVVRFVTAVAGASGGALDIYTKRDGNTPVVRMSFDEKGNVAVNNAALAVGATDGFLYIPSCPGTPTGVPTAKTGRIPIVVDSTNHKLYFYSGGAWRDAGP